MKTLSKIKAERGIWMADMPMPEVRPSDVLIKIKKTAICGTDLHIYQWNEWAAKTIPVPMQVGHEYVGEIVELGSAVTGLEIGQRVTGEGHITCGTCRNCRGGRQHLCPQTLGTGVDRPGAFAEYLSIPATNVFPVPDEISDDLVSIFDPFGNAVHTALSYDVVGEDVLITGAGPTGLMAAAICRHIGARNIVITDINPYRLKLAETLGATVGLNMTEASTEAQGVSLLKDTMSDLGMKEGFDVGMEMSGISSAINGMIETLNTGAHMVLLGLSGKKIPVDWDRIVFRGLFLKGIYGREMYETWYKMVALLQSGLNLEPVVTHRFPVDEFQKGFDTMESGQCGKVVLEWL